jgi:hypothetical protein
MSTPTTRPPSATNSSPPARQFAAAPRDRRAHNQIDAGDSSPPHGAAALDILAACSPTPGLVGEHLGERGG